MNKEIKDKIIELYKQNNSSQEIKDILGLTVTVRSIQRFIKSYGITRTVGDAYRLAVSKGRVVWAYKLERKHRTKLSPFLRYKVLERDGYKCVKCGDTRDNTILEIDHINNIPDDNREENLQTLCHDCNFGKPRE